VHLNPEFLLSSGGIRHWGLPGISGLGLIGGIVGAWFAWRHGWLFWCWCGGLVGFASGFFPSLFEPLSSQWVVQTSTPVQATAVVQFLVLCAAPTYVIAARSSSALRLLTRQVLLVTGASITGILLVQNLGAGVRLPDFIRTGIPGPPPFEAFRDTGLRGSLRFSGPLPSPNLTAMVRVMLWPIAAFARKGWWRLPLTTLALWGIWMTGSRGGQLALLVQCLSVGLLWYAAPHPAFATWPALTGLRGHGTRWC
jgi:hypothetical protein